MNKQITVALSMLLIVSMVACSGCISEDDIVSEPEEELEYRTVVDMRGAEVTVPADPDKVIDISRGLVNEVMYIFDVDEAVVGGSFYQKPPTPNDYTWKGKDYTVQTQISLHLMPRLADSGEVTNVGGFGGPYGGAPNVESLIALDPDLVILRDFGGDDENTMNFISLVEETGLPVVVLKYPDCYESPSPDTIYEEVRLLGEVFGYPELAEDIISTMKEPVDMIRGRTSQIAAEDRKDVLFFGAPTWAGDKGGVGIAFGIGTIEVAFLDSVLNADNVYNGHGRNLVSSEQLLAMDPDVILLPTWSGYHPPRQLYGDAYSDIVELRALKGGYVYALATTPVNSQRLEFPINLMISAKAIYPELFEDIDITQWTKDYLCGLYGIDENMAGELLGALMFEYLEIA
jgi:iron complex transport system substrate-binding protein